MCISLDALLSAWWVILFDYKEEKHNVTNERKICNAIPICLEKMHVQCAVPALQILEDELSSSSFL